MPSCAKGRPARPWGVSDIPITYDPPVGDPSDIKTTQQEHADEPDLVSLPFSSSLGPPLGQSHPYTGARNHCRSGISLGLRPTPRLNICRKPASTSRPCGWPTIRYTATV